MGSTGTKAELRATLSKTLKRPRFPSPGARILSVDMGVKNLAFCVLEVKQRDRQTTVSTMDGRLGNQVALQLTQWKRLDLSTKVMRQILDEGDTANLGSGCAAEVAPTELGLPVKEESNLYTPSQLCKVAYSLASEFVKQSPDIILIERQRFRSMGGSAIQEWTVRVNMLESMLWASLETMRHGLTASQPAIGAASFPEVMEMNPRTISSFWLDQVRETPLTIVNPTALLSEAPSKGNSKLKEDSLDTAKVKRSLEKKDKIELARRWLSLDDPELAVDDHLIPMVSAFLPLSSSSLAAPRSRRKTKAKGCGTGTSSITTVEAESDSESPLKLGKLDDLADCLVQAVTFTLWEENRRRIYNHKLD